MRKVFLIIGVVVLVLVVAVGGLFFYAAANLNSIIAQNREYLLTKVSDSLGRKVEVSTISVKLGWGVSADLKNVKIADNPAISTKPFVEARDVYADVAFLPLLSRELSVSKVVLEKPEVRIIRTAGGVLNIATIGKKTGAPKSSSASTPSHAKPGRPLKAAPLTASHPGTATKHASGGASMLSGLFVSSFQIQDGTIVYEDRKTHQPPVTVKDVNLSVRNFSLTSPFNLSLSLAAFGQSPNLNVSGTIGPFGEGHVDVARVPLDIKAKLGPLVLADLRNFGSVGKKIPEKLKLTNPVTLGASVKGTLDSLAFTGHGDLTNNAVGWGSAFSKPTGVPFTVSIDGSRHGKTIEIASAVVRLSGLNLKATQIRYGQGVTNARIDTNSFALGPVAKVIPALEKYRPAGSAEMHVDVRIADKKPNAKGTIKLANVSVTRSGAAKPMVSGLSGDIRLNGNSAVAGPLTFGLGSSHATMTVNASSLQPLRAKYDLTAASVALADIEPKRPADEHINNLKVSGTVASQSGGTLNATTSVTSSDGLVQNVSYQSLDVVAALAGKTLNLNTLKVDAFGGKIAGNGQVSFAPQHDFALQMSANGVNLQQLLESQKSKAADMVRGILVGQVKVSGAGTKFDQIKPTLLGSGGAHVTNAKLVGLNVAATALGKIQNLPAIGSLVPASVVERHPELFKNPNTDIQDLSLTFTLKGPRVTSHDLLVKTQDYTLKGDGWFDLDKNIDLLAHILLSTQLSKEIIAEKKNVAYLTNRQGKVDVPLEVRGTLPKPAVLPDVQDLVARAGRRAIEQKGSNLLGKFLGKGRSGGSSGTASPQASPSPGNSLNKLKKLF